MVHCNVIHIAQGNNLLNVLCCFVVWFNFIFLKKIKKLLTKVSASEKKTDHDIKPPLEMELKTRIGDIEGFVILNNSEDEKEIDDVDVNFKTAPPNMSNKGAFNAYLVGFQMYHNMQISFIILVELKTNWKLIFS